MCVCARPADVLRLGGARGGGVLAARDCGEAVWAGPGVQRGAGGGAGGPLPGEPALPHRPLPGRWVGGGEGGREGGRGARVHAACMLSVVVVATMLVEVSMAGGGGHRSLAGIACCWLQGKEMAQNLFVMRFANMLLSPLWDRTSIGSVQVGRERGREGGREGGVHAACMLSVVVATMFVEGDTFFWFRFLGFLVFLPAGCRCRLRSRRTLGRRGGGATLTPLASCGT